MRQRPFALIYTLAFWLALADALTGYIQSSFLGRYLSLSGIGLLLAVCAALSIVSGAVFPKIIKRFSAYQTGLAMALLAAGSSFILATSHSLPAVLTGFVVRYLTMIFLLIILDIFLEKISADKITGAIRTKYLTVINLAWLVSPFLMSRLVGQTDYQRVYLLGGLILTGLLLMMAISQRRLGRENHYQVAKLDWLNSLKTVWANRNLKAVFGAVLALNIFYCLAVLYVPLYLNQTVGLSWQTIGIIFTFMLLPFVLIQFPAGLLADKRFGEKEMLIAGNVIMAISSLALWLATSRAPEFWAALLFLSRIGAALAESMQEVYFYKQIDASQVGLINLFRQTRNVGWLAGAILAAATLFFLNIPQLFFIVAVVMLVNIFQLTKIRDTK